MIDIPMDTVGIEMVARARNRKLKVNGKSEAGHVYVFTMGV